MNGLALKIAMGNAQDGRSSIGSIALPEAQERRIFAKADELKSTMAKSSTKIAFGLGASAIATLAAGGILAWNTFETIQAKKSR